MALSVRGIVCGYSSSQLARGKAYGRWVKDNPGAQIRTREVISELEDRLSVLTATEGPEAAMLRFEELARERLDDHSSARRWCLRQAVLLLAVLAWLASWLVALNSAWGAFEYLPVLALLIPAAVGGWYWNWTATGADAEASTREGLSWWARQKG